uniref:Alternative protein LRRC69 n=1 Tax=Homo sapiens TaxID=9606 RepID=L8E766_HUMAN|nr:alternative protein LRRC69 [Homo sapiens]
MCNMWTVLYNRMAGMCSICSSTKGLEDKQESEAGASPSINLFLQMFYST